MANNDDHSRYLEEDISVHILSVSAAMVGVCLTVIGLLRVVITIQKADTVADDLLGGRFDPVSGLVPAVILGVANAHSPPHAQRRARRRCGVHAGARPDGGGLRVRDVRDLDA